MSYDPIAELRDVLALRESIIDGDYNAAAESIRVAHAFQNGNFHVDRRTFCAKALQHFDDEAQLKALESLRKTGSIAELKHARSVFDGHLIITDRIDVYLAAHGDEATVERELKNAVTSNSANPVRRLRAIQFAVGCMLQINNEEPDLFKIAQAGRVWLDATSASWSEIARGMSTVRGEVAAEKSSEDKLMDALSAAALDEPEVGGDGDDPFDPTAPLTQPKLLVVKSDGIIVVPPYAAPSAANRSDRHRTKNDFHPIAGQPLELVPTGDVAAHMRSLSDRAPHLKEVYETLLSDTGQSPHARFRPTILVGEPGTGKSWSAREVGKVMSLPVTVFSCGGVGDATFQGTAAHWSTSGASVPLTFILQARKANPVVVLDEIEKAASGDSNGRLVDALLTFLDRGNAGSYRDPSLEMTVDLSHVSYILTANALEGIPAPLRDRCRIIQVPNPGREHVPGLARHLIVDIAKDRGIDPRWYPPLAADELDVIAEGWGGGSIRQLRRAVEILLDGRDGMRGLC